MKIKKEVTVKTFKDLEFKTHPNVGPGGTQAVMEFKNGYGVSVITGEMFYTDEKHPYEMAIRVKGKLCYTTPITDDVLGYLTANDVTGYMKKAQELPKED